MVDFCAHKWRYGKKYTQYFDVHYVPSERPPIFLPICPPKTLYFANLPTKDPRFSYFPHKDSTFKILWPKMTTIEQKIKNFARSTYFNSNVTCACGETFYPKRPHFQDLPPNDPPFFNCFSPERPPCRKSRMHTHVTLLFECPP